ncbi:MAG TPA: signal peptidase I [Actinomycetota bacterium]|nr:signal peptidase I [Actinomycetota bacterium]
MAAPRATRTRSPLRELPVLVVVAFALALAVKALVVQAFFIPSGSMEPTLDAGDRVLVEKLGYRFGAPERGDVVVFERDVGDGARDASSWTRLTDSFRELFGFPTSGAQDYIKRVVAVAGETVEAHDGALYVDGERADEPYLPPETPTATFNPIVVPANHVFVLGDNRSSSEDSRTFGPVALDRIVGRAFVLVWPPGSFAGL